MGRGGGSANNLESVYWELNIRKHSLDGSILRNHWLSLMKDIDVVVMMGSSSLAFFWSLDVLFNLLYIDNFIPSRTVRKTIIEGGGRCHIWGALCNHVLWNPQSVQITEWPGNRAVFVSFSKAFFSYVQFYKGCLNRRIGPEAPLLTSNKGVKACF